MAYSNMSKKVLNQGSVLAHMEVNTFVRPSENVRGTSVLWWGNTAIATATFYTDKPTKIHWKGLSKYVDVSTMADLSAILVMFVEELKELAEYVSCGQVC